MRTMNRILLLVAVALFAIAALSVAALAAAAPAAEAQVRRVRGDPLVVNVRPRSAWSLVRRNSSSRLYSRMASS